MDRSMDSIGSCSLDVDADSSDISDTSGSLNFPTPLSVKDITREFTANIRERCTVRTTAAAVVPQSTTAIVDPVSGQVRMVLTQPINHNNNNNNNNSNNINNITAESVSALDQAAVVAVAAPAIHSVDGSDLSSPTTVAAATAATASSSAAPVGSGGGGRGSGSGGEKKPSYLNLACCVNGYSNLTTYDSKIRQDINKSREVSPIRPSSQALQYCKKNNALAPPVLHAMPNVSVTKQPLAGAVHIYNVNNNNNTTSLDTNGTHHANGNGTGEHMEEEEQRGRGNTSFIQQRVERLYGPGALAQGFYSPKKIRSAGMLRAPEPSPPSTELSRKFQQLSPSKDYSEFRKKLGAVGGAGTGSAPNSARQTSSGDNCTAAAAVNGEGVGEVDLPCLRHLSQEFRAQLPTISPKRLVARTSPPRQAENSPPPQVNGNGAVTTMLAVAIESTRRLSDEVDHAVPHPLESLDAVADADADDAAVHAQIKHSTSIEIILATPNETTQSQTQHIVTELVTVPSTEAIPSAPPAAVAESISTTLPPPPAEFVTPLPPTPTPSATSTTTTTVEVPAAVVGAVKNGVPEKDGNYFLNVLKNEQARLLSLASDAEKYSDALANNPDITEDTLGFLRSASGKARLLVSQKMKQFEGLCHNNLNRSPEDKFPTTVDDLQGFWDMVHLQVDHIDSIFAEIEVLKSNDWKKPKAATEVIVTPKSTPQHKSSTKTGNLRAKVNGAAGASAGKTANTKSAAALKRESQRKQLLEMKRKNRMAMVANNAGADDNSVASSNSNVDNANSIQIIGNKKSS